MRIFVDVKPKAREEKIEKIDDTHFKVWVREPPENGKANMAVIKVLTEYFNISWTDILLISGASSRRKVFQIEWHGM
ncbi:DUF167 domain-containing protein [Patescibacteria group bacterium]|nr:DUF167 domain-containing protein [Patescibacteria group bacterium]